MALWMSGMGAGNRVTPFVSRVFTGDSISFRMTGSAAGKSTGAIPEARVTTPTQVTTNVKSMFTGNSVTIGV